MVGLFFGMSYQLLDLVKNMGNMPSGLANYLANKRGSAGRTPVSSPPSFSPQGHPMVPMSPAMLGSIKASPKGVIPPGLARYLANKKKGKVTKKKKGYNFAAAQKKLGVVQG
jgi:hypothetical protein